MGQGRNAPLFCLPIMSLPNTLDFLLVKNLRTSVFKDFILFVWIIQMAITQVACVDIRVAEFEEVPVYFTSRCCLLVMSCIYVGLVGICLF